MEAMLTNCCGVDLHRDSMVACIISGEADEDIQIHARTFGTTHTDIEAFSQWLAEHDCGHVAMESTGVLWMPIYNALSEAGMLCSLVNARHCRNLPGRKTDWNDAQWIAHLYRHGMLRSSYVPNRSLQTLRQYTRSLETLRQDESREKNRVEKLLQTTGYKLSSVLSDIFGVTGRRLLNRLAEKGRIVYRDAEALRDERCRRSAGDLAHAMQGKMTDAERKLLAFKLRQLDQYAAQIRELQALIDELVEPYAGAIACVDSIPGVGRQSAIQIIGEIGVDMDAFGNAEQLASWAGLCPRNAESAGKKSPPVSCPEIDTSNAS